MLCSEFEGVHSLVRLAVLVENYASSDKKITHVNIQALSPKFVARMTGKVRDLRENLHFAHFTRCHHQSVGQGQALRAIANGAALRFEYS
jgi:hypothetical protein